MIHPKRAMLLAAGRGERMRPLTDKTPKPLLELGGRSLAERALDRLADAGVEEVVVNLHHLGEQLKERLKDYPGLRIYFSEEEELLDTAGGVAKALPLLGEEPFYVVNGDAVWLDGMQPALLRLAKRWCDDAMDALLLLHPTVAAVGYDGPGDFRMTPSGRLLRRPEREIAPFAYTGVQLVHPRLFEGAPVVTSCSRFATLACARPPGSPVACQAASVGRASGAVTQQEDGLALAWRRQGTSPLAGLPPRLRGPSRKGSGSGSPEGAALVPPAASV